MTKLILSRLSEVIAEGTGLHFPEERWPDLERGLTAAACEFGCPDVASCGELLLSGALSKAQLQILASHLTVGETYFFREKGTFDVLAESILPALIHRRRQEGRRLRLWSAACCTGEEPYSLAILLQQIIPDLADWHITVLATDLNARFLQKAAAGIYGEWSFRESSPEFKERYFQPLAQGRYEILPEIRKRVTFAQLNLVEDMYPALATDTNAMDLIFCRNVLMYFTLPQARKVLRNLHHALLPEGWLAVSPGDGSLALNSNFVTVQFPGVLLYQRSDARGREQEGMPAWERSDSLATLDLDAPTEGVPPGIVGDTAEGPVSRPAADSTSNDLPEPVSLVGHDQATAALESRTSPVSVAAALYENGDYAEVVNVLLRFLTAEGPNDPAAFSLLARALANQGKLGDALAWCDRWVGAAKMDPAGHYLRAVVLQELGNYDQARHALKRALYLHPDFVLAHFALGNVARNLGAGAGAERHFANALHLLRKYQPEELLPHSDGLTAGRLTEIISSLTVLEAAR